MANTFMLHNITDVEITDKKHTTDRGHEFRCIDIHLKTTDGDIAIGLFPVKDANFAIIGGKLSSGEISVDPSNNLPAEKIETGAIEVTK